jgi:hypothetical protein
MRFLALLIMTTVALVSSAQSQGFSQYTVGPFTGCCNGSFNGSPLSTDFIGINRVGPGNVNISASLPLGAFASAADLQTANGRIDQAFHQVGLLNKQVAALNQQFTLVSRGVAASAAMGNSFMPSAPGRTSWAVNAATFNGETGAGFSLAHRLNLNVPIAVTAGYSNGGGNAHVGRIGLMGEF